MTALNVVNVVDEVRLRHQPVFGDPEYAFGQATDAQYLQEVIDALDPLNPGILYFPPGTYRILEWPLRFERFRGLWIQGAGAASVLDAQSGNILLLLGCQDVRVSHLSFIHGRGTAISIVPADAPEGGLSPQALQMSGDVRVEACRFDGTGDDLGIHGSEHCAVRAVAVDGITIVDNTLVGSQILGGLSTEREDWIAATSDKPSGPAVIRGNIIRDAVEGAISWGSRSAAARISSVEIVGNVIEGFGGSGIRLGWDIEGQPGALQRVLVRNNIVKASARSTRSPGIYGWAGPGSEQWTIDGNVVTTVGADPDKQYGILIETEGLWPLERWDGEPREDEPARGPKLTAFGSDLLSPGHLGGKAPPPGRSFDEVQGKGLVRGAGARPDAVPGTLAGLSVSGNSISAMDEAGICVRGAVTAYVVSGNLVGGPGGGEPSPATAGIWIRSIGPEGVALDGVVAANVVQGLDRGILLSTRAGAQTYLWGRTGDLGPVLVHDNICKDSRPSLEDAPTAGIAIECVEGTTARVNLQANRCYDDRPEGDKTQDYGLRVFPRDGVLDLFDPGNNDFSGNKAEVVVPDGAGLGGWQPFDPPRFGR